MLKNLKKQLLNKVVPIILIVILVFVWIPVLWHREIILDKAVFATEYYKTIADIGKILFGFWLANIFLQKIQAKEFVQHFYQQWQEQKRALIEAISSLETIPDNPDIKLNELTERIRESDTTLCYLSDVILKYEDKNKIGMLGTNTFEYKENLHNHVNKIIDSLENGETINLRPFRKEISQSIDYLKKKLSTL